MQTFFVALVRGWFQLEGGVGYGEMFFQTGLQGVKDAGRVATVEATVINHHVGGQCGEVGRDRPGVQVVNIEHVVDPR